MPQRLLEMFGENDVQHQVNSCTPFFFCVFLAGLTNISFLVAISFRKMPKQLRVFVRFLCLQNSMC